jgi:hypothetical protein
MTNDSQVDSAVEAERDVQTPLVVGAMLVRAFFVCAFAACITGSYHRPYPSNVKAIRETL